MSTLSFNSNGKITLLYGKSGYGKTSLLEFFRWMFYNDCNFGPNNDKPFFNIPAYEECDMGDTIEVSGQVDFEHLGVSYRLNRTNTYIVGYSMLRTELKNEECQLYERRDDGGYHPFTGNIANQINSILPKELSKYFLLDGEHSRNIVLNPRELKKAIYSLFGLDIYSEALTHIGSTTSKTTVLGHYAKQLSDSAPSKLISGRTIPEWQAVLETLSDNIDTDTRKYEKLLDAIEIKRNRHQELVRKIGLSESKSTLENLIREHRHKTEENIQKIKKLQENIGTFFYKNYTYLFLAQIASESSIELREKNQEYLSNYKNVFLNLRKELLEEIREKGMCVCGRHIDDAAQMYINDVLSTMPPSFEYDFKKFVARAKSSIENARDNMPIYASYINDIAELERENARLDEQLHAEYEQLRHLKDVAELADELQKLDLELAGLEKSKETLSNEIAYNSRMHEGGKAQLKKAYASLEQSHLCKEDVEFFEKVEELLHIERNAKETQVRNILNNCVKSIFAKLTTQTDFDLNTLQFIKDDFSLRETFVTGGQAAIDVYSYVIGIIKSLQECQMEDNESPIIIDAPFAFTDEVQSEHIFETLPKVSKQTILLTLDLNKVKKLLCTQKNLYDFYIIKNDTQNKAKIEEGNIDAINW